MRTDDELYGSFLSGDKTAYDELMIRYGDSLVLYLHGYLRDWEDAEDLMIEAFARIMVKKPKIGDGAFRAYLYKTARNLAARFHSNKSKKQEFSFDEMEEEIQGSISPETEAERNEKKEIIKICLDRIDPELREVLWLVYVEGLSYDEAAQVMKLPKKRVDRILQKGKEHMRKELHKEGIDNAYEY